MRLLGGSPPSGLGVRDGRLKPTPATPNAVSSQAQDRRHAIAPLTYATTSSRAMEALVRIVETTPRTRIVARTPDYLYAECRSALLGFVDDVEFWFEPGTKLIQVRSASRIGHTDFGVNRARIEAIRRRLAQSGA